MKFSAIRNILILELKKKSIIFLSFVFVVLVCSCSQQKQFAKEFINQTDTINILILKTDTVFKKNLKTVENLSPSDTMSIFLEKADNKTIINLLHSGLIDNLKKKKLNIFTPETIDSFLSLRSKSYFIPRSYYKQYDSLEYFKDYLLNAVSLNLWFEVSELNGNQEKSKVLFSSKYINDSISGYFKRDFFSNEIYFDYLKKDITIDNVYLSALDFGSLNADYIFDYLLNQYIYNNSEGKSIKKYFHYNFNKKKLSQARLNRFIFM